MLLSGCYILLLVFVIWRIPFFKNCGISKSFLTLAFFTKLIATFALYLVYTKYYNNRETADIFKYYDDSQIMLSALKTNPSDFFKMFFGWKDGTTFFEHNYYGVMNYWYRVWENAMFNDNRTLIRINAFFGLFAFGNFHIHQTLSAFCSLVGTTGFYIFFQKHIKYKRLVLIAIFFLPSLLFWGSGVLKETFIVFFLGLFLFCVNKLKEKINLPALILCILICWVLLHLKPYIILIVLPYSAVYLINNYFKLKYSFLSYLVCVSIIFGAVFYIHSLGKTYDIIWEMYKKQEDFLRLAKHSNANSILNVYVLDYSVNSFIFAIPIALKNSFLLKMPWQSNSILELMSIAENYLFLFALLAAIFQFKNLDFKHRNIVYLCFFTCTSLLLLIGWTIPVLGAIVRYRVPALLFWIAGSFVSINSNKTFERIDKSNIAGWIKSNDDD